MIRKPVLPAVEGYVEVEIDGVRKYRCIKTGEITDAPNTVSETERLRADIDYIFALSGWEVDK